MLELPSLPDGHGRRKRKLITNGPQRLGQETRRGTRAVSISLKGEAYPKLVTAPVVEHG